MYATVKYFKELYASIVCYQSYIYICYGTYNWHTVYKRWAQFKVKKQ